MLNSEIINNDNLQSRIIYSGESLPIQDYVLEQRQRAMKGVHRVVVKVGSAVLTTGDGIDLDVIDRLGEEIAWLKKRGYEFIVISSGAISSGARKIGLKRKPASIPEKQAAAAAGQSGLMRAYEIAFGRHQEMVAQVLLTRDDLSHRRRFLNARNTLTTLLRWRLTPIINENDTVMVEEIKFGDNDNLSAMISSLVQADLLINLTNIEGLYDRDPRKDSSARLISMAPAIDRAVERMADKVPGTEGRGGMYSKIQAAKKVSMAGVPTVIGNGRRENIIRQVLSGAEVGTFFPPQRCSLASRKYWLAFTTKPAGTIVVDEGAREALVHRGKSLLSKGVKEVRGQFGLGAPVACVSPEGRDIAVGLVNYSSTDLKKIVGLKSSEIEGVLGYKFYDEVIHRDNMVIVDGMASDGEGGSR